MAAGRVLGAMATVLLLGLGSACGPSTAGQSSAASPTPSATQASPTPVPTLGPLGAAGCQPVSPSGAFTGEVFGTATSGTVWAWFMAGYPPQAGISDKTIWRLDGPGVSAAAPTFSLFGPASRTAHLDWGPAFHDSSTWNRPGDEYGTGLLFPAAGCWDVHVIDGQVTGDVYVVVI
jgi:hypothetical protein